MNSQDMNSSETFDGRNQAEYPVLGVLAFGAAHGYDICRYLDEHLGQVIKLGRSQVYALLSRLERGGLLKHKKVHQDGLPSKKVFSLTELGEAVVYEWVRSPVRSVRELRLEFATKLYFARRISPEAEKTLLKKQLTVCEERYEQLNIEIEYCRTDIERQVLDFRRTVVTASINWLDKFLNKSEATTGVIRGT
jgi:DNA-binding PadR family transcriptional regulator